MKLQNISGMRTLSFGRGEKAMVVVPGLTLGYVTDNASALEAAFAAFTEDYTVYIIDVKEEVPDGYTLRQMGDDLAAAVTSLGLRKVCLYGCSMGGSEALYIAGKYPELVDKLVVAAAACRACETLEDVLGRWIGLAKAGSCRALTSDMGQRIYSPAVYEASQEVFAAMADSLTEELLTRFINTAGTMADLDIREETAAIRCPLLVLGALGDRVMTAETSREIAEVAGAELFLYGEEFPHAVYDEAPDFRERAKEFFSRL